MKRQSPYFELRWRVDCKAPPNPATWWETIVAFNSDRVALQYAADCRADKAQWSSQWQYRVMERFGRGQWREIRTPSL